MVGDLWSSLSEDECDLLGVRDHTVRLILRIILMVIAQRHEIPMGQYAAKGCEDLFQI